jgi:hypothetical protein
MHPLLVRCDHNVIIATLPGGQEHGIGSAAALASQVKKFIPNLWFGLLVGVAGLVSLERHPVISVLVVFSSLSLVGRVQN